jgi:hypothetical protein
VLRQVTRPGSRRIRNMADSRIPFEHHTDASRVSCPRCGETLPAATSGTRASDGTIHYTWRCTCGHEFETAANLDDQEGTKPG